MCQFAVPCLKKMNVYTPGRFDSHSTGVVEQNDLKAYTCDCSIFVRAQWLRPFQKHDHVLTKGFSHIS